jgi:hypothetical protein
MDDDTYTKNIHSLYDHPYIFSTQCFWLSKQRNLKKDVDPSNSLIFFY